jgi:hypothetical protein
VPISKPFFVRPLAMSLLSSSGAAAGHPASNLSRMKETGLTWQSSGSLPYAVSWDFGTAQSVDFVSCIAGNAQPGTTFSLILSNNSDFSSPLYSASGQAYISPSITRADGLYHSHHELPSPVSARYLYFAIGNHTGTFEASALVIGKKITPSHFYNLDYEYGIEDLGALDVGRFGVLDETPGKILRTIDFSLGWQSRAEFETSFRPMMEELGTRGIVYFCMKPDADVYRQANTYMGVMKKPGFAKGQRKPETFSQDYSITSLI